jgi:RHS repeat-associated protein
MKRKSIITLALVATITSTALADFSAPLPEFKTPKQLAVWRTEMAAKAEPKTSATQETAFYTGKPYLASSGNYAFKFRSYNPELARWTSEDPSGFPDGANSYMYAPIIGSQVDPNGLFVKWIAEENSFSKNPRYQKLPATTFSWSVSYEGVVIPGSSGSFTGTFSEIYAKQATVGFVTWRGLDASNFGQSQTLNLLSYDTVDKDWFANGYSVTAGFLENVNFKSGEIAGVNKRLKPIGAGTSKDTIRGLSGYLYQYLLGMNAGYNHDLFYE